MHLNRHLMQLGKFATGFIILKHTISMNNQIVNNYVDIALSEDVKKDRFVHACKTQTHILMHLKF